MGVQLMNKSILDNIRDLSGFIMKYADHKNFDNLNVFNVH